VTVGGYARDWTARRPRHPRTNETYNTRLEAVLGPLWPEERERAVRRGRARQRARKDPLGVRVAGAPLRGMDMRAVRRPHAVEVLDALLRVQGRSQVGARGILATFSAMWADALEDDVADFNPFTGVRVRAGDPRIVKATRRPRVLSWADMHRLAGAAGEWEAMLRAAADCGLRLGELLAVYRADLKLGAVCDEEACRVEGPHLHVRRTAHEGMVSDGTKRERLRDSLRGGRVVPVPPGLEVLLRGVPRRIDTPLLFPTPSGRCWWEQNFRSVVWQPASAASGVAATPQDFRHSWVSHLRAAALDPADLAEMAGHSVLVADAVYTHALGRSFDAARKAVGG
jgi:integrase